MVKIIDVQERINNEGENFNVIIVGTEPKMIESENGNFRYSCLKAGIPSDLPLSSLQTMIGKEIEGEIKKVECEPYTFIGKNDEEITLEYRYMYSLK